MSLDESLQRLYEGDDVMKASGWTLYCASFPTGQRGSWTSLIMSWETNQTTRWFPWWTGNVPSCFGVKEHTTTRTCRDVDGSEKESVLLHKSVLFFLISVTLRFPQWLVHIWILFAWHLRRLGKEKSGRGPSERAHWLKTRGGAQK